MALRILLAIACSAVMGGISSADDVPTTNVGDYVAVELTGDAALKYSRISTRSIADGSRNGRTIQITAELHKATDAADVRLLHHAETTINTKRCQVMLAGTLPAKRVIIETSPAGTAISASPTAAGTPAEFEAKTMRTRLSDLDRFKLQRWQLIEEIVD